MNTPQELYVFGIDIGGKFSICAGHRDGRLDPLVFTSLKDAQEMSGLVTSLVGEHNITIELVRFEMKEVMQVFGLKSH